MTRRKPFPGILLWDYIKDYEQPETLVRAQLDRGELRYTWKSNGNLRASDDGGPQPPKGWWLATLTTIDRETNEVRGQAHLAPSFERMSFVRVFPVVTAANPPPEPETSRRSGGRGGRAKAAGGAGVLPTLTDRDGKVLYPDGKVPGSVPITTVHEQVNAALTAATRKAAKLEGGEPKSVEVSWHTVNRALDRE